MQPEKTWANSGLPAARGIRKNRPSMEPDRPRSRREGRRRRGTGWLVEEASLGETSAVGRPRRRRRRRPRPTDAADHFKRKDEPKDRQEEFSLALVALLAVGILLVFCLAYIFNALESEPAF